jgi:hypothetical protein
MRAMPIELDVVNPVGAFGRLGHESRQKWREQLKLAFC